MKAPVFKGVGKPLVIEDLPDPTPGPGEVVLEVGRCGICGTDLHMTDGHAQTFPEDSVIGHEFAGTVVAVGTGFAQYAIAKASAAIKLPASMSLEDGALVEPLAVSLHGVTLAQIAPGARVLVQGAGPIGVGAAYWAKRVGAGRVVVTARSNRGEAIAIQLGADRFVVSDAGAGLQEELNAALGGQPDVIFECTGATGMIAQAVNLVRARGTIVILGNCMLADTFYPAQAMFKQVRIQGSMIYSVAEFETVARSFDAGHLEPRKMVTDIVGYAELPAAFEALRTTRHQCKVMVNPWVQDPL